MTKTHNRKALVLGGMGLIGGAIAEELTKNYEVTVLDRKNIKNDNSKITHISTDVFKSEELNKLIQKIRPNLIINAINIATIFSADPKMNYQKIISFYLNLYHSLKNLDFKVTYIQIGTTGSGGLGFNIPFTHGDKLEDLPIINKAAFAGISDAMLTLLSRSFANGTTVSEIKPGLAIFHKEILSSKLNGINLVLIDGGESGCYTYNEFALLTCFMGFTTVDTIVAKIKMIIDKKTTIHNRCIYDTIASLNNSIISESNLDKIKLRSYLKKMKKFSEENYIIATGKLGPPTITRDLILAFLKLKNPKINESKFDDFLKNDLSVTETLKYIKKSDPSLYVFLSKELNFINFSNLSITDSSPWSCVRHVLNN